MTRQWLRCGRALLGPHRSPACGDGHVDGDSKRGSPVLLDGREYLLNQKVSNEGLACGG